MHRASLTAPGQRRQQQGSALLLLLAVLTMAAASLLMQAYSGAARQDRYIVQTNLQLAEAREALMGYAMQHGRLPRPAASALDGSERAQPCANDNDCSGFLPWVALGVHGADSWGKLLRYSVNAEFTRRPVSTVRAVADKVVLHRDPQRGLVFLVGQRDCDALTQCSPAVIFSNGKNNLGTSAQGVLQANPVSGNVDEQFNDHALRQFISRPLQADPRAAGGEFDDLVTWVSLQTLYQRMAVSGVL